MAEVPEAGMDIATSALTSSGWKVEEAVKNMKVQELVKCPSQEWKLQLKRTEQVCRALLKLSSWDLAVAKARVRRLPVLSSRGLDQEETGQDGATLDKNPIEIAKKKQCSEKENDESKMTSGQGGVKRKQPPKGELGEGLVKKVKTCSPQTVPAVVQSSSLLKNRPLKQSLLIMEDQEENDGNSERGGASLGPELPQNSSIGRSDDYLIMLNN